MHTRTQTLMLITTKCAKKKNMFLSAYIREQLSSHLWWWGGFGWGWGNIICNLIHLFLTLNVMQTTLSICLSVGYSLPRFVLYLTLLHSEWPKLYGVLAILSAIGSSKRVHIQGMQLCQFPILPPFSLVVSFSRLLGSKSFPVKIIQL